MKASCTPCSGPVSFSGHLVALMRRRNSVSSASGTCTRTGRIAVLAVAVSRSSMTAVLACLVWCFIQDLTFLLKMKSLACAPAAWHAWHDDRAFDDVDGLAGLNVLADASNANVAYPHPLVSGKRFEFFTMNDTSVGVPGTVTP